MEFILGLVTGIVIIGIAFVMMIGTSSDTQIANLTAENQLLKQKLKESHYDYKV